MKVQTWPIDRLVPYARNPRVNSGAVDSVAASIREFGWRVPLVVAPDGTIVCGHTRLLAARKLGMTEVPVHIASELTEAQLKAFRILDNKSHELATWDTELLPLELADLKALGIDLTTLAFPEDELKALLAPPINEGLTDPDEIPAPPEKATTRPGDVWTLGAHRLCCGDSALAADVDRLLDGAPIHLVNTDPPYGVRVEPRSNNAIAAGLSSFQPVPDAHHQKFDVERHPEKSKPTTKRMRAKDRPLANDFLSDDAFAKVLDAWFANIARVLLPGHGFFIWGGYSNMGTFPAALAKHGLYFSQAIVWHKQHPVLTRKDFMGDHEWSFYGWREGAAHRFFGPNNVPDVWSVKKVNPQAMVHLTEKPVELAARAIQYSSLPGENVLDLFGGSGSTLIAAEQHGRKAFLMELDAPYCDVILQRWEGFTGRKAELVRTAAEEKAPATAEAERNG